jgi:hypothetical protein
MSEILGRRVQKMPDKQTPRDIAWWKYMRANEMVTSHEHE